MEKGINPTLYCGIIKQLLLTDISSKQKQNIQQRQTILTIPLRNKM